MAITISIALQKGGTGKTTTAQALASTLGSKHKKVLLVDMDSQSNVTSASGVDPEKTITDIFAEECSIHEAIVHCSLYDLIGSDQYLANLEAIDPEDIESTLLKNVLAAVQEQYDFIVLDTPPLLGNILKQALMASDYLIIPVEQRPFALDGLDYLQATIEEVQSKSKLKVLGILLIKYSNRTILNRQIADSLNERAAQLHTTLFKTTIREGIAVAEAQTVGQPLIEYAPKSKPCIDYKGFTTEVLKRLEEQKNGK